MKKNFLIAVIPLICGLIAGFFLFNIVSYKDKQNASKVIKEIEDSSISIIVDDKNKDEDEDEDEEVPNDYQTAYRKGYNAFLKQLGRSDLIDNHKVYSYTSFIEKDSKDSFEENTEEVINRGYTDGYHKASEAIYCPKSDLRNYH